VHHNLETLEIDQQQIHKVATAGKNSSVSLANNDYQKSKIHQPKIPSRELKQKLLRRHYIYPGIRIDMMSLNRTMKRSTRRRPPGNQKQFIKPAAQQPRPKGGRRGRGKQREGAGGRIGNWGLGSRPRAHLGR